MLFDMFKKWVVGDTKTEARSSQTHYDIEDELADLIDNASLEMLTNRETRIILFKDPVRDIVDALRICLSSTRRFSPGQELAEVLLTTLEGYENFIDLRRQKMPSTIQAHLLAMEAARTLLMQAGLFQGTLRKRSQRSQQPCSS
jgi:hypothetical protein